MRAGWVTVVGVVAVLAAGFAAGCGDDPNEIDAGVRAAGIDVGGMRPPEARRVLERRLDTATERRLTAIEGKQRIRLPRPDPPLRIDVDALVREALRAPSDTSVPVRDHVEGAPASLAPLVAAVRAQIDVPPRDARLAAVGGGGELTSRPGTSVRGERFEGAILATLLRPGGGTQVRVPVETTQPQVTTRELAAEYPQLIAIDRTGYELRLYEDLELVKSYTVAVGAAGYDTPPGRYEIESKQVDPTWSVPNSDWTGDLAGAVIPPGPGNPLKARWLGFAGAAGIHGTDDVGSLGSAASHGCIRMAVPDVIDLYDRVDVGTPVYVS